MSGNSFGTLFRVTTFGESHGPGVGAVVDGAPPGLELSAADLNAELRRRRPGQSILTTQRQESDECEILSGVDNGRTLGTPIGVLVRNQDARPAAYDSMKDAYRPSHADFTYEMKYGVRAASGGGRASARETIGRVIGGVIARKALAQFAPIEIVAYVRSVHDVEADIDPLTVVTSAVEATPVRCPDLAAAEKMIARIDEARRAGDSVGGVVECVARGVPAGWGDPVFDKLDATLAQALLSLPAVKGFEVGSGFSGTKLRGSEHNDPFVKKGDHIGTRSNRSGGIQGGISNGEPIVIRAAFKPTATVMREQETVDREGNATTLAAKGRHDPCVLPRAVPIVEAMVALVLADHALRHAGQCGRVRR
jgi:chorismate synthase